MLLVRRIKSAKVIKAIDYLRSLSKSEKGVRPELCPSIRDFYGAGVYICSPINVKFFDKFKFDVEILEFDAGKQILLPGVIGSPESSAFYARIDTGFSFENLASPVIGLLNQNQSLDIGRLKMPPVIYPEGYTGPILMPLCSPEPFLVTPQIPLLHLIPTSNLEEGTEISDADIRHPDFEGLLYESDMQEHKKSRLTSSTDLVPAIGQVVFPS